jgi:hypothetical protein
MEAKRSMSDEEFHDETKYDEIEPEGAISMLMLYNS